MFVKVVYFSWIAAHLTRCCHFPLCHAQYHHHPLQKQKHLLLWLHRTERSPAAADDDVAAVVAAGQHIHSDCRTHNQSTAAVAGEAAAGHI